MNSDTRRTLEALKSGEIWIFRHDGVGQLSLEPSVYFDPARPEPRPSRQIVLTVMR